MTDDDGRLPKWPITRWNVLFFLMSVLLLLVLIASFISSANAQTPPRPYAVRSFLSNNIDDSAFDGEVNRWLRDNPAIEVVNMTETISRDPILGDVRIKSIIYRDR